MVDGEAECLWCGLKFDGRVRPLCDDCQSRTGDRVSKYAMWNLAAIAAHNVWAAYTAITQRRETKSWEYTDEASGILMRSVVVAVSTGEVKSPREMHHKWQELMHKKDEEHHLMVDYEELSTVERCKDALILYAIAGVLGIDIAE